MWEWILLGSIIIIIIALIVAYIIYQVNKSGSTGATGGNAGFGLLTNNNTILIQDNTTQMFLTSLPTTISGQNITFLAEGPTGTVFTVGVNSNSPEQFTLQSNGNYLNLFQEQETEFFLIFTPDAPGITFSTMLDDRITSLISGMVTYMGLNNSTQQNLIQMMTTILGSNGYTIIQA